jgi:hypothetical protein
MVLMCRLDIYICGALSTTKGTGVVQHGAIPPFNFGQPISVVFKLIVVIVDFFIMFDYLSYLKIKEITYFVPICCITKENLNIILILHI